jgi:hypothetical protein
VLLHELAHVKRRDVLVLLLTQFACAVHWFNPLAWLAAWRLHVERERACDNLVLTSGIKASDYAEHLLHVATRLETASPAGALAMARPSRLEGRLMAVLNQQLKRGGVTGSITLLAAAISLSIIIPVAMLRAQDKPAISRDAEPVGGSEVIERQHYNPAAHARGDNDQADSPSRRRGTEFCKFRCQRTEGPDTRRYSRCSAGCLAERQIHSREQRRLSPLPSRKS